MTEHVRLDRNGRVMTITLDRPESKNALTQDMYAAVADGLAEANNSDDVRAVILTAVGDAFTAGNDLGEFETPHSDGTSSALRFLDTIRDIDTPVIAAVNGIAVGVGLTLLLHCDLVFASEDATFTAPFTRIGLVPEAGSTLLLPRALGNAWANDILLTGRVLNASEALTAGLVSRVVPGDELLDLANTVARQLAALAPNAIRESKRLIRADRPQIAERMARESEVFLAQLNSSEFSESLRAFREGRPPTFD
jgi:enoyl-CoA hydratase/carnithine racemase